MRSETSFGIGDFNDLKKAANWAHSVGLKLMQLLPVNDTTATGTWKDAYPYAAISVFALHPIYLHLPDIAVGAEALLEKYETQRAALNALEKVDYETTLDLKWQFIREIFPIAKEAVFSSEEYQKFYAVNENWLRPYACFCYFRDKYKTVDFSQWTEAAYSDELPEELKEKDAFLVHYFVQYHLHAQLTDAAAYAHAHQVVLKGDIAIGVYRNSVDVWVNKSLYNTNSQAGAPPDDFAVSGQNWGFPTYNWPEMKVEGYDWWRNRLGHTSQYFDAIRLDHVLGFFRIWSIPVSATQGILGHFEPAIPIDKNELYRIGVHFPLERLWKPFIHFEILKEIFVDSFDKVVSAYFEEKEEGIYLFKEAFSTQRKLVDYFDRQEKNTYNRWLLQSLMELLANVILLPVENEEEAFHFRFNMQHTSSFQYLNNEVKNGLLNLYDDYFFHRQNDLWKSEAMEKLPAIKNATNMLVCGEDLGFVPNSVPEVMQHLGLLGLYVQRMPKQLGSGFENLKNVPYLSVVSPSTHDTSTIRGWWLHLSRAGAQSFYNNALLQEGIAPAQADCPGWLNRLILQDHLQSPAMWSIFLMQDLLNNNDAFHFANVEDEQINHPENPNQYWQYRMPIELEQLADLKDFNQSLKEMIAQNGR
ncbi:4-alpha-glucanotransferase [Arachidicoccus soli]|uniref:4-alpha-glucanotransferase n=1 Tax=Arachidicoccus soli TaxID=2341117 RepID=UPI0013C51CA5|nr:4-alpha-glucanotransferase [Arachidicoccus soli]